jgi:hypothetical protein
MEECINRTWMPCPFLFPDKVNRGHNSGIIKGIITKFNFDLCGRKHCEIYSP